MGTQTFEQPTIFAVCWSILESKKREQKSTLSVESEFYHPLKSESLFDNRIGENFGPGFSSREESTVMRNGGLSSIVMNASDMSQRLLEVQALYEERHGALHPVLRELSPQLRLSLLELSLEGELQLDAQIIERALRDVDHRIKFLVEQGEG